VFPCHTPEQVRSELPSGTDVVAFQCRNPIHRAHYELFIRALDAPNVAKDGVVLVHPTCGPTQVSGGVAVELLRGWGVVECGSMLAACRSCVVHMMCGLPAS